MNTTERVINIEDFEWGNSSENFKQAITKEIFLDTAYERVFEVEEGDVVVDIGASAGPFLYSIKHKNPSVCYAIEPIDEQLDLIKKNLNGKNVNIIKGAISEKKYLEVGWDGKKEKVNTFTFEEFINTNRIKKIDFLKCDCEGGEYDIFKNKNIDFLINIPKMVIEFHLEDNEDLNKCRFRWFRDNILNKFKNYYIYALDGTDIKWDLWNEHFIEYYNEVIIHIDNR